VDKDVSVLKGIGTIKQREWRPFRTEERIATDREIAETVHATNKGKAAFRLVVLRWRERQGDLFGNHWSYHCIATGKIDQAAQEVVWRYSGRAHLGNHIKEIKTGFAIDRMPSGEFRANAVHFGIGIMTYSLFIGQRLLTMPEHWSTKTIKTIRWLWVEVEGKLIHHGRTLILKVATHLEKYRIYLEMRKCTYALRLE
jgi:hypothetical protein